MLFWWLFSCASVWGEEFSRPRDFSNFESNLGEQKLVEVVRPWVGPTLNELAPGAIPLGSMKGKTYLPAEKFDEKPEPLIPVNVEKPIKLPENQNFPLEFTGEPVPVDNSAPGWVGPLPSELAPRAIPLGSLANRKVITRTKQSDYNQPALDSSGSEKKDNFLRLNTFLQYPTVLHLQCFAHSRWRGRGRCMGKSTGSFLLDQAIGCRPLSHPHTQA